jgi:dTDP-glucose 4,6-dehydratase
MADLLITGGAGFIGTNFVRHWRRVSPSDRITVLDALTYSGNRASLDGLEGVELVVGDICDTERVLALLTDRRIDTIVHFAAESHVDRSITGPDAFITTNVVGTHSLLKAAKTAWLDTGGGRPHRFHHISTDEVYGSLGPADAAFRESTAYAPNSPYSASKAASDHLVRAYHHTYGLQTTTSNCSNNYGPYQFPEKLIPLFILNALSGHGLPIYGDGLNVRDWLHVDDHCMGIELIMRNGKVGDVYNIGGGQELPNIHVIDEICAGVDAAFAADPSLAVRFPNAPAARGLPSAHLKTYVADRKGHDRRYAIDESKIRSELGYLPARDFAKGLAETIGWYLAQEAWWQPLIERGNNDIMG